ncbi:MAG: hypothetical protein ACOX50_05115 [Patescibacteria group bacterium]|jgi:hypothetical protein
MIKQACCVVTTQQEVKIHTMKVWFGATSLKIEDYINYYREIRNYLVKNNLVVVFDWIDDAYDYKVENPSGSRNIKNLFKKVTNAIDEADISVIEYTVPNFSSSHQIMYSILKRKPTLVMRLQKDNSFSDSYLEAIESPFLLVKEYTLKNYKEILDEFIGYCQIEDGLNRYNVVLDKKQKYYLDWASSKRVKSRSEMIREAIDRIVEEDEEYKKYISKI